MSIFRERAGDVSLVWRLLMIIGLFVAVAFLLRFVPIVLCVAAQSAEGVARDDALDRARSIVFEDPLWASVIGAFQALLSLPLVWFMTARVERRRFAWRDFGLDWRRSSLLSLALGLLLAFPMYAAYRVADLALGAPLPSASSTLAALATSALFRNFAMYVPMGFSEELVFRGYVQTRLVGRLGAVWGILMAGIVFTASHMLFMPLSAVELLSGVLLWVAVGAVFHWSRSLYLVGVLHGMLNTLQNTLPIEESEVEGVIIHALVVLLVVVVALVRWRTSGVRSNQA